MMKQVTKEQFDVLKDFVPTEVRYYAESVSITETDNKSNGRAKCGKRRPINQRIHLTTKNPNFDPSSIQGRVFAKVMSALDRDPTKIIGRRDLSKAVQRMDKSIKGSTVDRTIADLVYREILAPADH